MPTLQFNTLVKPKYPKPNYLLCEQNRVVLAALVRSPPSDRRYSIAKLGVPPRGLAAPEEERCIASTKKGKVADKTRRIAQYHVMVTRKFSTCTTKYFIQYPLIFKLLLSLTF
jgi:hypothetical protein